VGVDWQGALVYGAMASAALAVVLVAAQGAGLTRLDLPLLLGTVVTTDPDRARLIGTVIHLLIGLGFSMGYAVVFSLDDGSSVGVGAALGLVHAAVAMGVLVPLLPMVTRRIASERSGPWSGAVLEPPGFMAIGYGPTTPILVVVTHVAFGVTLGLLLGP